ncbi:MAG: N-acyl-D-aspartate/D-glutamate deacylase [Verrucomicrobiales bacterium]|nr:N-acyl-D-aspartate/D-glutamate deacylase [Verrucomicrobiales bacterium]
MPKLWCLALVSLGFVISSSAKDFDLILRNGKIVDGTGKPAFIGDVAIKKGRIASIGNVSGTTKKEIDLDGLVIAPGFIDVHTHADELDDQPGGTNFVRMGVTTIVVGNCGGSNLRVGDFFKRVEKKKISPNVATLLGHGTVRGQAMGGTFNRPPTEQELSKMKLLVKQAMKDGAVGLSTGLIYTPGVFARTEEIIELAKVVSAYGGIYATHQRSESEGIVESLNEIFRIAREANIRAEVSHIKLSGPANWGKAKKILDVIEAARAEGLQITQDQYSYTASSTSLGQLVPDEFKDGGKAKLNERIENPTEKSKMAAEMKLTLQRRQNPDYSYAVIAFYKHDTSLNGLSVVDAAKKLYHNTSLDSQIETILEIERNGGASAVFHGMNEQDLQTFMQHTNTMIACDSGLRTLDVGVPHPRGYGNNARVLQRYVKETKVLTLEDAIRKMSSLPAHTFELSKRGEIRPGNWADLVVFDLEKVKENSTYNDPHHYSSGFNYVFVNGVAVVKDDEHTGKRPGKALRHTVVKSERAAK